MGGLFDLNSMMWDESRMIDMCGEQMTLAIIRYQRQQILHTGVNDKLMFTWSNNGEFLVNGAYSMLVQAQPLTSPIGSDDVQRLWRGIWKNKGATPRIRTFFWKAMTEALPSAYALSKKIANIETSCRVCGA